MGKLNNIVVNFKQAIIKQKPFVLINYDKKIISILDILKAKNLIKNFKFSYISLKNKEIEVFFKYEKNQNLIKNIYVFPKKKIFFINKRMPLISKMNEILFVSTTKGIFTETDLKQLNLGGQAFLKVEI